MQAAKRAQQPLCFEISDAHKCLLASCTQVQAWSNKMGGEGGKLLADAIKAHANYEQIAHNMFNGEAKVNMSNKRLDAGDAWIMGAALEKNDTVTEVAVSSNNLGVEGGKAFAESLKSNTTITQVCSAFSCACKLQKCAQ